MKQSYKSFKAFYPYYLQEHKNRQCRLMHFIGSTLVLLVLIAVLVTQQWVWLWSFPLLGYGFAWVGGPHIILNMGPTQLPKRRLPLSAPAFDVQE